MVKGRLSAFVPEARAIAADARAQFGGLTPDQLNWKPGPDHWSVAQCLDHLVRIDAAYWPVFQQIEAGTYRTALARRIPGLAGLFGRFVLKAVEPQSAKAYRTAKHVQPAKGDIDVGILSRFERHQQELIDHMEKLDACDADDVVVPSPVFGLASYSVYDALRIIVAHERRHLAQARRVTETPGFPQSSR
jgi:hypothetical protein